jgi:hypothetical protein
VVISSSRGTKNAPTAWRRSGSTQVRSKREMENWKDAKEDFGITSANE